MIQTAERGRGFIHTLEIDVRALRSRSNNPGVDVDRVGNLPVTPAHAMITSSGVAATVLTPWHHFR
jgi:hypothetical protein